MHAGYASRRSDFKSKLSMIPIVQNNIDTIKNICKKYEVESLYLVGSAARGEGYKTDSDIDFILRYKKNKEGLGVAAFDYFDLLFELENLFNKKVDLVVEESIKNYIFKQSIERDKQKIYEA
jgi:predicted nucleotidyltransferase